MVIARAVARDHYGPSRAAGVIARLTMVMVVAPMVAPAIGGVVADLAGWRAIFVLVCIAGIAAVGAVVILFRESHRPEDRMESALGMLRGFAHLLVSPRFVVLALLSGFLVDDIFLVHLRRAVRNGGAAAQTCHRVRFVFHAGGGRVHAGQLRVGTADGAIRGADD
jgi:DHA1 family bicyclomycin/chloramphenicol resistance-like MFS transporter